jgi:hypothetical protein
MRFRNGATRNRPDARWLCLRAFAGTFDGSGHHKHRSERQWAIENAYGLGRGLCQALLKSGESVLDVPPALSRRVRLASKLRSRER